MNTCGTCKYFGDPDEDGQEHYRIPDGYKACAWIKHNHDKSRGPSPSAIVIDASDYYATLCVHDDFGCNQWAPKESEDKLPGQS